MTPLIAEAVIEIRGGGILRCKSYLSVVCCMLVLAASCFAASDSSATKPCRDSVDSYVGYKLSDVRLVTPLAIKTPLSFLFGSQKKFEDEFAAVLAELSLKKGDSFDRAAHNAAIAFLHGRYEEAVVSPGERIRIAFVTFRFENCDDGIRLARGLKDVAVRDPVYRTSAELTAQLRDILEKTQQGRLTPPEVTKQGIELYAICDKKQSTSEVPGKREVREEILNERFAQQGKNYLKELRAGAMIEYR